MIEPGEKQLIGFDADITNSPLGDVICLTSIPENVYKTYGIKLIDMHKIWAFNNNPYVLRDIIPEKTLNFSEVLTEFGQKRNRMDISSQTSSLSDLYCKTFNMKMFLRHPRLYRFENNIPDGNSIAIHTTSKGRDSSRVGPIPLNILEHIYDTYKEFKIFQVGGVDDFKIDRPNVIDKTGLCFLDTAEIISKCGMYIGVNSGHIHLANCYPRTKKKLLLFADEWLSTMIPQDYSTKSRGGWIDFNWSYYNTTDDDIGVTMSFLKI